MVFLLKMKYRMINQINDLGVTTTQPDKGYSLIENLLANGWWATTVSRPGDCQNIKSTHLSLLVSAVS